MEKSELDIPQRIWAEIYYRLDVCKATDGENIEIY